jgi:hypothetical protein
MSERMERERGMRAYNSNSHTSTLFFKTTQTEVTYFCIEIFIQLKKYQNQTNEQQKTQSHSIRLTIHKGEKEKEKDREKKREREMKKESSY